MPAVVVVAPSVGQVCHSVINDYSCVDFAYPVNGEQMGILSF